MRSLVAALVLLGFGIGGLATAGAGEPDRPPVQSRPTPTAGPAFGQPYIVPRPIATAIAPEKPSDAVRIGHLRKAAEHLQAAGLDSLADHVRGLLCAPHPAQPPQEASRWRPHEGAPQVMLAIKIVEIDEGKIASFGFDPAQLPSGDATPEKPFGHGQPSLKVVGPEANLPGLIEALRKDGSARVLSQPTLVTVAGRPASFRVGGQIPLWTPGPDRQPVQRLEHFGTSVDFVPLLTGNGNLRLELRCEFSEVDRTKTVVVAGKENPIICRTAIDTAWEMKPGQTIVVARHGRPDDGDREGSQDPAVVMLVTPEVVEATAALPSPDRFERR